MKKDLTIIEATEEKEKAAIGEVIESKAIAPQDAFGKLTRAQVELIKRTVAKGASDDELRLFIQVCKGAQLNPFMRQAHLVPFWDSKDGVERRTIIVGIDGFRAIAESSGAYAGNDDPIFEGEDEISIAATVKAAAKKIIVPRKATVNVYKIIDGQRFPFGASARWAEYYPGAKKGMRWIAMPYLMLGKCAEALALRKAFPKLLSGIYAQEEMDQAMREETIEQKSAMTFSVLTKAISRATIEQMDELEKKMETSDKYSAAQKKEFAKMVEARKKELTVETPKIGKDAIEQAVEDPVKELSEAKKKMVEGMKNKK